MHTAAKRPKAKRFTARLFLNSFAHNGFAFKNAFRPSLAKTLEKFLNFLAHGNGTSHGRKAFLILIPRAVPIP